MSKFGEQYKERVLFYYEEEIIKFVDGCNNGGSIYRLWRQ